MGAYVGSETRMTRGAQKQGPSIVWFRDDLRLADNEALTAAGAARAPLLCVYIFDEESKGFRPHGGASRWWLHHSLAALGEEISEKGGRLDLFRGRAQDILPALAGAASASAAFWTRRYGGAEIALDTVLKTRLIAARVKTQSFNGQLLHEPWEVKRGARGSFMVYSPYWRAALALPDAGAPLDAPEKILASPYPRGAPKRKSLDEFGLLPKRCDWAAGLRANWRPGEKGAQKRLGDFLANGLQAYASARDRPADDAISRLSPHLRFGEISPRQIFAAVRAAEAERPELKAGASKFLGELGWREFNYHVLFSHPNAATTNLQRRFDAMPWRDPPLRELKAWRRGQTGYPLVDAGMRELWTTGFMHNRARMAAASFLVKHLLVNWRIGEEWFWDTLCDADPANNPMNWQWVAGSGADAAPYFRVFNPVLQGEKFDPRGDYVRRWIPELAALPDKWIHKPWAAPAAVLREAGVELGKTYPKPVVDLADGRDRALKAFEAVRR
ncbi:Deoxyribodipyrimidine photo-lyase [Methylocella tundrae]|uniref:Deoxyribodipyrimidine photo-lyase n=2 Tax=Methylocella tundrae TaxID=227605 RepID=A0A4U8YYD5_METTU|nr:Deoxyribodipyrimidine photo-lyase [Methylocella tundrae]